MREVPIVYLYQLFCATLPQGQPDNAYRLAGMALWSEKLLLCGKSLLFVCISYFVKRYLKDSQTTPIDWRGCLYGVNELLL